MVEEVTGEDVVGRGFLPDVCVGWGRKGKSRVSHGDDCHVEFDDGLIR